MLGRILFRSKTNFNSNFIRNASKKKSTQISQISPKTLPIRTFSLSFNKFNGNHSKIREFDSKEKPLYDRNKIVKKIEEKSKEGEENKENTLQVDLEKVPYQNPKDAREVVENLKVLTTAQRIEEAYQMLKDRNQVAVAYGTFQSLEQEDPTDVRAIYGKVLALEQGVKIFQKEFSEEELTDSHPAIKKLKVDLNRLIQLEPQHKEWIGLRSEFKRKYFKDKEGALSDLEMVIKMDESDYQPIISIVEMMAQEGDFESAFKYLDRAIQVAPSDKKGQVMCGKANLLMSMGDYEGAKLEIDRILKFDPKTKMANALKSKILLTLAGDDKGLIYESSQFVNRELETMDQNDPDIVFCYKTRADINFKLEHWEDCEKDFEAAIKHSKDDATLEFYVGLGTVHFQKKEYAKAIEDLSKALNFTSQLDDKYSYQIRLQRAKCSFLVEDWEAVDRDITILTEAGIEDPELYYIRSKSLLQSRHYDAALMDADTYVRLERGSVKSRLNRAEIMGDLEMSEAALEDFNLALQKNEREALEIQPDIYWLLATIKLGAGSSDEALQLLETHRIKHNKEVLSAHYHGLKSKIYISKGMTKEAIEECKKALRTEVNPDFLAQMGKALGEDGQFEQSLVYFDKAMKLDKKGQMKDFVMQERQKVIDRYASS